MKFIIHRSYIEGKHFKWKTANLMCLFYLLFWMLVPAFSVRASEFVSKVLFALVALIWIATAIANLPKQVVCKMAVPFGIFFSQMLLYVVIHFGDAGFYSTISYVLLFAFALNAAAYNRVDSRKLDLIILWYVLILLLITTSTTIIGLFQNGNASRLLTSSSTDIGTSVLLKQKNIGSFDLIYGLVIAFPTMSLAIKRRDDVPTGMRIGFFALTILSVVCIIKSNFTTALLLLFVAAWLPVVFSNRSNIIAKLLLILIVTFLVPILLPYFLNFAAEITTSIYAKQKIENILLVLFGETSLDSISTRFSLFQLSLSSFLSSPVWGVGAYYNTSTVAYIGKHAQFMDDFARYGLLGGIPLMIFLKYSFGMCFTGTRKKSLVSCTAFSSIVLLSLLGFMNPVYNYGILVCLFIVAATLSRLIERGTT